MRPTIVTVVSNAAWETRLVETARTQGMARIRGRCASPIEVEAHLRSIDAIVVGGETPWLSTDLCRRWRERGVRVVGVAAVADRPARRMLAEADIVVAPEAVGDRLLARLAGLGPRRRSDRGRLVAVLGPRGAPGCTEVALALARRRLDTGRAAFVEIEGEAPDLAARLPPDGSLRLVSVPPADGSMAAAIAGRVVEAARAEFARVVLDGGPRTPGELGTPVDSVVLVIEPSEAGLIRAERLVERWTGVPPLLVVNRCDGSETSVRRARRATGLEPAAVIPRFGDLVPSGDRRFDVALEPLDRWVDGPQVSAAAR